VNQSKIYKQRDQPCGEGGYIYQVQHYYILVYDSSTVSVSLSQYIIDTWIAQRGTSGSYYIIKETCQSSEQSKTLAPDCPIFFLSFCTVQTCPILPTHLPPPVSPVFYFISPFPLSTLSTLPFHPFYCTSYTCTLLLPSLPHPLHVTINKKKRECH